MTKGFLSQNGVTFTEVNVLTNPAGMAMLGRHLAIPPLVLVGDEAVSGYRRKRLRKVLGLA